MQHHDEALGRYLLRAQRRPEVLGVVLAGSLARGTERPDSDIDLYVVVTEEAWAAALREERIMFVDREDVGYPDGYFDVKLVTPAYLDEAADHGDDPVRDSFAQAKVLFSRGFDLEDRVSRIHSVPEERWDGLVASFVAQGRLHGEYFLPQGLDHGDPLLVAHAALHLATAAARALLAVNHVPFAGPKYLLQAVATLATKPPGFDDALIELVTSPSAESGAAVLGRLEEAAGAALPHDATLSRFVLDNELAWRTRVAPPEYR
jgi:predicted nucleotidyltransferase